MQEAVASNATWVVLNRYHFAFRMSFTLLFGIFFEVPSDFYSKEKDCGLLKFRAIIRVLSQVIDGISVQCIASLRYSLPQDNCVFVKLVLG